MLLLIALLLVSRATLMGKMVRNDGHADGRRSGKLHLQGGRGQTVSPAPVPSPGGDIAIKDGKADGNNISFSVTFDFGGMPFTMNYKGVVSASEIKFTIDVLGMPLDLVVKKTT